MDKKLGLLLCLVLLCGGASAQTYSGDYLEVKMNPEKSTVSFNHFHLTDSLETANGLGADSGSIVVTNQNVGFPGSTATEAYSTEVGSRLAAESTSLLALVKGLEQSSMGNEAGDEDAVTSVRNVMEQSFIQDSGNIDDECGSCNLAKLDGGQNVYDPRGQVISAYDTPDREDKNLYLCNTGAPDRVVYGSPSRAYRCDSAGVVDDTAGDWDSVVECNDGLDNDNDGDIDFGEDNGCSSPTDETETVRQGSEICSPFIGKDSSGSKAAFYNAGLGSANPLGNGCDYEVQSSVSIGSELDGQPPTFRCTEQGEVQQSGTGDSVSGTPLLSPAERFCGAVSSRDAHMHSGTSDKVVRSVIYSYRRSDIPYSPKAEGQDGVSADETSDLTENYVEDSGFQPGAGDLKRKCAKKRILNTQTGNVPADAPGYDSGLEAQSIYEGGFVLRRCETVHHAENRYARLTPYGGPHSASTWESKGMADLGDGYNEKDSAGSRIDVDRADSWVTAQPGGDSTNVVPQGGDIADVDFSKGGFVGRCPGSGQWQYVTSNSPAYNTFDSARWMCGNPNQITVNFYQLKVRDYGEKHVGFQVDESQITRWMDTFTGPGGPPELKMDAACWPGRRNTLTNADGSANTDLLTNITVDLNTNSDTIAGLKLEDSTVPADRYTCVYGFRQTGVTQSSLIPGNKASFDGGAIVEGIGGAGSIRSTGTPLGLSSSVDGVRRPGFPDDAMSSGEVKEQQFLENHNATNSGNVAEVSNPFADYPSGSSRPGSGRQSGGRNPLREYLRQS